MIRRFAMVSLALAGLLFLDGCDLFDDEEVGAGSGKASSDWSGYYRGSSFNTDDGVITSVTVHHDYSATATGPTSATIITSNNVSLTGNISGDRIVAYGTDGTGKQVRIVATFWTDTTLSPPVSHIEGHWIDSHSRAFDLAKYM